MDLKRVTYGKKTKKSLVFHVLLDDKNYTMSPYRLYTGQWNLRCTINHNGKAECQSLGIVSVPDFFDSFLRITTHGIKREREVMILEKYDKRLLDKQNYQFLKCSAHTCKMKNQYYDTQMVFRNNARLSAMSNTKLGMSQTIKNIIF